MADADYFLKIDGIPGESQDKKHKDEIQLEGWAWGEANSGAHGAGGGGGAGKVAMHDFTATMRMNKASPKLFLYCANGKHIKEALLTCRKAGGKQEEYLKIKFTDLLVSSYQTGGNGSDIIPIDNVSLNFSKIEVTYAPQGKDGPVGSPVTHWYNLKEQEGA
jgi:type VI secretion system secreted protein Hcp